MTDPSDLAAAKKALRSSLNDIRNGLDIDDRLEWDAAIAEAVLALPEIGGSGPIAGYWPWKSEVDARAILEGADRRGMACALPAFGEDGFVVFRAWKPWEPVVPVGFGTLGPGPDRPEVEPLILIVPMLGFDRSGARIGYGQGHYDRAIARLSATGRLVTVGVAYAQQEVERLPLGPHDRRVDIIVTPGEIIRPAMSRAG